MILLPPPLLALTALFHFLYPFSSRNEIRSRSLLRIVGIAFEKWETL